MFKRKQGQKSQKIVSKLAKMQEMIRVPTSRREEYKFDMSESNPTLVNIQLDLDKWFLLA